MKRLDIKNWEKQCKDMDGKKYVIQYGVDKRTAYRLSIHSHRTNNYYQMSIDKECRPGEKDYQVWLYNMNDNISYPMTIGLNELMSKDRFMGFLETTIELADDGSFSGENGNLTTNLY